MGWDYVRVPVGFSLKKCGNLNPAVLPSAEWACKSVKPEENFDVELDMPPSVSHP
jgi:hypothetical protein